MTYTPQIKQYFTRLDELLKKVDAETIDRFFKLLDRARVEGRQIFIFGNGGSGSTASHLTGDLNKGSGTSGLKPRFKIICLNDNIPSLMAYANDFSYEDVFVQPLMNFLQPGDVVIGISGSGNSKNVLRAIEYANQNGGVTVGICGYDGGALEKLAQLAVHPHVNDMQLVEDFHLILGHVAMQALCPTCC